MPSDFERANWRAHIEGLHKNLRETLVILRICICGGFGRCSQYVMTVSNLAVLMGGIVEKKL